MCEMPVRKMKNPQPKKVSPVKPRATRAAVRAAERARALKEREESDQKSKGPPSSTKVSPIVGTQKKAATKRKRPAPAAATEAKKVTFEKDKDGKAVSEKEKEEEEKEDQSQTKKRKVIVVDYMKHASQETKQRRATSTARKEQVGVEQQQLLSEEMRSMIGKGKRKSPTSAGACSDDVETGAQVGGTTCFIDDSLLPFVVEDSSSAAETATEMEMDTDDSDINATDSPAKYLRKRFSRDERRRQSHEKRSTNSNPYLAHETIETGVKTNDETSNNSAHNDLETDQGMRKGKQTPAERRGRSSSTKVTDCKFLSARHNRTRSPPPTLEDVTKEPILREPPASHLLENDRISSDDREPCTCGANKRQHTVGESLVHMTGSDTLKKRDYSQFVDHRFHDATYKSDMLKEREIVKNLCAHIAAREQKSLKEAETVLEERGYGKRVLTMESFDIRRQTYGNSNYPTSSRLRCCYDHHTFNTIPILVPVKYYEDRNILTVFSNWVFCSFSCLVAWIERDAPLVVRKSECIQMAMFVARKFFGITDRIYPAPFRQQHIAYGGRLTTEQWRSLCTTHCSFLQYPLAVSVPCTIVTEITLQKRLDRDVLARIAKRTEEAHANSGPEKPEYGDADAKGAYKRGKKEGKGRPMKRRTMKDSAGQMVTLDKNFLDQVINKARDKKEVKGAPATGIQALMGIKTKPS